MPRVRQVPLSDIHPAGRRYYEALFKGGDPTKAPGTVTGSPGHWWSTIALRPYIFDLAAAHLATLYGFLGEGQCSKLAPQVVEIALTRTGFLMESQFVYSQHCKVAASVGVPREKIDAIPHWGVLATWSPLERAVLAYTDAFVLERGRVQDGVFTALHAELSDEDIMELTYHIGGYMLHAGFCRALHLEWDDVEERIVEVPMPEGSSFRGLTSRAKVG
jgi:alkylhydroperoxidase family enzyme